MADKLLLGETVTEHVDKINTAIENFDETSNRYASYVTSGIRSGITFDADTTNTIILADAPFDGYRFVKPSGVKIIPYEEDENGNKTSYIGNMTNNNNQSVPTVHALMKFLYGEAIGSYVTATTLRDDEPYAAKWEYTGETSEDGSKKYRLNKQYVGYTPIKGYNENLEELVLRFMLDFGQEGNVVVFCDEALIGEVRYVLLAANGINRGL